MVCFIALLSCAALAMLLTLRTTRCWQLISGRLALWRGPLQHACHCGLLPDAVSMRLTQRPRRTCASAPLIRRLLPSSRTICSTNTLTLLLQLLLL